MRDDMVEQRAQRSPVPGDIDEKDRLVVQRELTPGQDLEKLIQRSDAARQHRKGIGALGHDALAVMHRLDDEKLADSPMRELPVAQGGRNDAGDAAAAC